MTIQSGASAQPSSEVDMLADSGELAAMMAFPNDETARRAYAIYTRCDRAAHLGQFIQLTAEEYFFITSDTDLTRPGIYRRADSAHKQGINAAAPFFWNYQRPQLKPSLTAFYKAAQEYKQQIYSESGQTLKEQFPASDSNRVDRKYFEDLRSEFESVLHFWMAMSVFWSETGHGPNVTDPQQYQAFLVEAERCAEYLGSIAFENRHAPPVDISKLHRVSSSR